MFLINRSSFKLRRLNFTTAYDSDRTRIEFQRVTYWAYKMMNWTDVYIQPQGDVSFEIRHNWPLI